MSRIISRWWCSKISSSWATNRIRWAACGTTTWCKLSKWWPETPQIGSQVRRDSKITTSAQPTQTKPSWRHAKTNYNPSKAAKIRTWRSRTWWLPSRINSRYLMRRVTFSRRIWVIKFKRNETTTTHKWFTAASIRTISSASRTQTRTITIYRWLGTSHTTSSKWRISRLSGSAIWCIHST